MKPIRIIVVALLLTAPALAQVPTPAAQDKCAECTAAFLQALTLAAQQHAACMSGQPVPSVNVPQAAPTYYAPGSSDDTLLKLVALLEQRRESVGAAAIDNDPDAELRRMLLLYSMLNQNRSTGGSAGAAQRLQWIYSLREPSLIMERNHFPFRWLGPRYRIMY